MYEKYMDIVFNLAKKGHGFTTPNPLVGALLVKDSKIIGRGYHEKAGGPHAEINALRDAGDNARGSSLYVNLEPCCHYGRTPPCVDVIVRAGVKKVIVAMTDPNPKVSGDGLRILRENNIEVVEGVMEEAAKKLNEIFICYITREKPFVIMKVASSLDGKIATRTGDSKWITGDDSRNYVHHVRNMVTGIMVGVNTVIKDDPQLTVRLDGIKYKNPVRIIVDSRGRTPIESKVFEKNSPVSKTIIVTTTLADRENIKQLERVADIIMVEPKNNRVDMKLLMDELYKREIDSILIEGGGQLNASALEEDIVDKVMFFISPVILGGNNGVSSVGGTGVKLVESGYKLREVEYSFFKKDILVQGYIGR